MARETVPPARSSRGKVTTRRTLPAVADGLGSALQTGSTATSTSTMATIQASFANAVELFNSLLEACTISCLTNAQYHSSREAWLDTMHRWFMFAVIALGAAALADVLPKLINAAFQVSFDPATIKEVCAAGAAVL